MRGKDKRRKRRKEKRGKRRKERESVLRKEKERKSVVSLVNALSEEREERKSRSQRPLLLWIRITTITSYFPFLPAEGVLDLATTLVEVESTILELGIDTETKLLAICSNFWLHVIVISHIVLCII